jgi:hypothetical protein
MPFEDVKLTSPHFVLFSYTRIPRSPAPDPRNWVVSQIGDLPDVRSSLILIP